MPDYLLGEIHLEDKYITLDELCEGLSISKVTGRNWLRLGKITAHYSEDSVLYFDAEYVAELKKGLTTGELKALKSRRNKAYVSGQELYSGYVSDSCKSKNAVAIFAERLSKERFLFCEEDMRSVLGLCALDLIRTARGLPCTWQRKLIGAAKDDRYIIRTLYDEIEELGAVSRLIWDIFPAGEGLSSWLQSEKMHRFLGVMGDIKGSNSFQYQDGEDVLGLLYMSIIDMGSRKAAGSYFTPTHIVRQVIEDLKEDLTGTVKKVCDPCCGTGNFLIQLPKSVGIRYVYGADIDPVSVSLARLNVAMHFDAYSSEDIDRIYGNITCRDFLFDRTSDTYDMIVGNPPWGITFDKPSTNVLKKKYSVIKRQSIEASSLFVEQASRCVTEEGIIAFVLPESLLDVNAHSLFRSFIYNRFNVNRVRFLGNVFHKVHCPAVLLELTKKSDGSPGDAGYLRGPCTFVADGNRSFVIHTDRNPDEDGFCFRLDDQEYGWLTSVLHRPGCTTLKGQAEFGLGIVTGDNQRFVSDSCMPGGELVLKGTDIEPYRINLPQRYMVCEPEQLQQCAPMHLYRAPEKLVYRFISKELVFAYDDRQLISLNSCNIVVPHIEGLDMKYILAVLNSSVARNIYRKKFNSVKVLRSHIEAIPIPLASRQKQDEIIEYVDMLIKDGYRKDICDKLDELIWTP